MADLIASGEYPGTQYVIDPSYPGVYREDRSVTTTESGTQMFRVYGAALTGAGWVLQPGASAAYATVQNTDGSIHYYTLNTDTGLWEGSGNNAVYNAVDYGLVPGSVSATQQAANVAAIQAAVTDAINAGGGTVVIPAGVYELSGTVAISDVTGGLTIRGESTGTTLVQYGTTSELGPTAVDIFDITGSGNNGNVGIRFREIYFQYAHDLLVPDTGAIAINCISAADTTAQHCGFLDCPTAFAAGSVPGQKGGLHCGLINCTILQDANGYDNATQVILSGPEAFVMYCEFFQTPMTMEPDPGPTGCTHIAVTSGADGCRIESCHISAAYYGITIADSKSYTYIANCKVDAAEGLRIIPGADDSLIQGIFVTSCSFGFLEGYSPPNPTSGIYIDTAGGPSKNVESISIVGCLVYGYQNAGIFIGNGQSISVIGGKYSSNGQDPETTLFGAGIAITQACTQVRVVGADCSGVYEFWRNLYPSSPAQPYGIAVLNGATSILAEACDLTSNATAPLYVTASETDLRAIDCIGYNDQATVLQSSTPPPSSIAYNISWANVSQGWYGPIAFYVKGAGQVTIDGIDTYLTDGAYTLSPGETASVASAGTANHFLAVGK